MFKQKNHNNKQLGKEARIMKKILVTLLVASVMLCVSCAYAATSANITVSATIPTVTGGATVKVYELTTPGADPTSGTIVTSMNFGTLSHLLADGITEAGVWYSPKYFCVVIYADGFGRGYQISSTSVGLSSGGNSIPAGGIGMVPDYQPLDRWVAASAGSAQGSMPAGSALGSSGTAVASGKLIYRSEAAGSARIIRAFYSIPPKPDVGVAIPFTGFTGVPTTLAPGTYTGTVTITIVPF